MSLEDNRYIYPQRGWWWHFPNFKFVNKYLKEMLALSNLRLYCSPCMSWHWRFHFCLIGFRITLTFSPLSNWLNSKFYEIQGKTKELVAVQIWTGLNAWSFNNFREFSQIKEFLMFTTWHISFFDKIQGKPSTLYVVGWVWTGFYFFSFNKLNKFRKLWHQILEI